MLKEVKRESQADQKWQQLQQSGPTQRKWNRRMPRPGEIAHKSKAPGWNTEHAQNTPTWRYLFYWSMGLNVLLIGGLLYVA